MSAAKKSKTPAKGAVKAGRPASASIWFAAVCIAFVLTVDAYYLWQMLRV
jgi:hypothetical protein